MKKAIVYAGILVLIVGLVLVISPFIFSQTRSSPYVPDSAYVINEDCDIFPSSNITKNVYLTEGDLLYITGMLHPVDSNSVAIIDFLITDDTTTYFSFTTNAIWYKNWTVPLSQNYSFIFSSSDAAVLTAWVYSPSEILYRDVTVYPSWFSLFVLLGICLSIAGGVVTIVGLVKNRAHTSKPVLNQ
jgi:hypothetical protein